MKRGLDKANITLWVLICVPSSQARVTSAKSWSFLNPPNAELRFSWKSFHLRQSFSEFCIFSFTWTDWVSRRLIQSISRKHEWSQSSNANSKMILITQQSLNIWASTNKAFQSQTWLSASICYSQCQARSKNQAVPPMWNCRYASAEFQLGASPLLQKNKSNVYNQETRRKQELFVCNQTLLIQYCWLCTLPIRF